MATNSTSCSACTGTTTPYLFITGTDSATST